DLDPGAFEQRIIHRGSAFAERGDGPPIGADFVDVVPCNLHRERPRSPGGRPPRGLESGRPDPARRGQAGGPASSIAGAARIRAGWVVPLGEVPGISRVSARLTAGGSRRSPRRSRPSRSSTPARPGG